MNYLYLQIFYFMTWERQLFFTFKESLFTDT